MDFADEDYRRLYVRRTVTSKRLGWEGRAVRNEMLTEFDRAGIWECGDDPAADIADLVDMPIEIVRVGLERLLAGRNPTWVMGDGRIVWPNFVEAQTCGRSDRVRQQEARDRRRADAIAKTATLTSGVTDRHDQSRIVTPPSLPSRPSLPPEHDPDARAETGPESEPSPERTEIRPKTLDKFVPDSWEPNDTHRMRCQELRFDLEELVRSFRLQEFNREYSDWDKRFSKWIEQERINRETASAKTLAQQRGRSPPPPPKGRPAAEVMREMREYEHAEWERRHAAAQAAKAAKAAQAK